jgi:hypothetical protein
MGGKGFEWPKALAAIIRAEVILAEATLAEVIPEVDIQVVVVIPGVLGEAIRAAVVEIPMAGRDTTGKTSKIIRESGRSFTRQSR